MTKAIAAGPVAQDTTVDVLIMGSGTGLAAALAAKERGLSVLVVEKTPYVGGSTARSGGAFWIPGNEVLQREGDDVSREKVATYINDVAGDEASQSRLDSYLWHGPAAVAMLRRMTQLRFFWSKGYPDYHSARPGSSELGHTCESEPFDINKLGAEKTRFRLPVGGYTPIPLPITGADYRWINLMTRKPAKALATITKRVLMQGLGGKILGKYYAAGGQALAAGMFEGAIRAGIPIWTRTSIAELHTDRGAVVGATIEQHGNRYRVYARYGVVLAAGGFDHNRSMRRQYQSPSLVDDVSLGAEGNTGDSLSLGQSVGARLSLMEEAWWFPAVKPTRGSEPRILLAERSLPGSIIVDQRGERFVNEAVDYMSFGQRMLERERRGDPIEKMWLVFDQKNRNNYLLATSIFPRRALPKAWFDQGIAFEGDSPAELAIALGISSIRLERTIRRFNENASQGKDPEFHRGDSAYDRYYGDPVVRPNPNLRPLTGKLFAVRLVLSDLGTCGGLDTDERARVIHLGGHPIRGLYAIGNNAANAFGRSYPGAGATIGQGITFGYIAAQTIGLRRQQSS